MAFKNREDAGRRLAKRLAPFHADDVVVLGLPRGRARSRTRSRWRSTRRWT